MITTTTVYNFTEASSSVTWADWIRMGGCGISNQALGDVSLCCGAQSAWAESGITLWDIARASKLADRELSRFAACRLGLADIVTIEYA